MTFTPREREAMRLICDTFASGDGSAVPSASAVGAVDLTLEVAAGNPRRADVRQLRILLRAWNTRALGLALTGRSQQFSRLDQAGRERFLLALSDSDAGAKRALFGALKGAALLPYYLRGGTAVWEPMGYPGALGVRDDPPPPGLESAAGDCGHRPDLRRRRGRLRCRRRHGCRRTGRSRARRRRPRGRRLPRRA